MTAAAVRMPVLAIQRILFLLAELLVVTIFSDISKTPFFNIPYRGLCKEKGPWQGPKANS
jgi:hypothetical protein